MLAVFHPEEQCNPCGFTMKMSSRYHRLLIDDVKRTTKIVGMGPFNLMIIHVEKMNFVNNQCFGLPKKDIIMYCSSFIHL